MKFHTVAPLNWQSTSSYQLGRSERGPEVYTDAAEVTTVCHEYVPRHATLPVSLMSVKVLRPRILQHASVYTSWCFRRRACRTRNSSRVAHPSELDGVLSKQPPGMCLSLADSRNARLWPLSLEGIGALECVPHRHACCILIAI